MSHRRQMSNTRSRSSKETGPPLFTTSFPTAPRRQPPSLNNTTFSQNIDSASTTSSAFRHADSTSRALSDLARTKHGRMERRRALALLAMLVFLAVGVHLVTTSGGGPDLRHSKTKSEDANDASTANVVEADRAGLAKQELAERKRADKLTRDQEQTEEADYLRTFQYLEDFGGEIVQGSTPLYWHIPRSGGSTIKSIMGQCLELVMASEVGVRDGHDIDPELEIIEIKGFRYVNVDTTSLPGIERAHELNLADSGLPQAIVSSYLAMAAQNLFNRDHPGRAFTLLRNPIERAMSMYHYRKSHDELDGVTLEQYAKGNGIENNWMTRYLVNQMEGELGPEHLDQAKIILKKKFLVGFLDDLEESLARMIKYHGWQFSDDDMKKMNQEDCIKMLLETGINKNDKEYQLPKKGTQAYALISWQTQFDLKLYDFAKDLFASQTKAWGTKERKKAEKKKKAGG